MGSTKAVSWIVEPLIDSGGNMFIAVKSDSVSLMNIENTTFSFCLAWQEMPSSFHDCRYKLQLNDSRVSSENGAHYWYVAFPESGRWILSLTGASDVQQYLRVSIELAVGITSCPDECSSSLLQGTVSMYQADGILFSACHCKAGWRGIACTDARNALDYNDQRTRTVLLTLSNIMFIPCVVKALYRGFYIEALVYFFVFIMSTFYHACDQPETIAYCILPFDTLQFSDFLGAVSSVWFTFITIARLDFPYLESWLKVFGCLLISLLVVYDRFNILTFTVPCLLAGLVLITSWTRRSFKKHKCFPGKKTSLVSVLPGFVFAIVGVTLYAGVETEANYYLVHSSWHVLMACSVLFLLPPSRREITRTWWFKFLVKRMQTDVSVKYEQGEV